MQGFRSLNRHRLLEKRAGERATFPLLFWPLLKMFENDPELFGKESFFQVDGVCNLGKVFRKL